MRVRLIFFLMILCLAPPVAADNAGLQRFIDEVRSLSADFEQIQKDESGAVLQQSSGRMWLQRAAVDADVGRFRWSYEKPYQQLIVCDGRRVWLYDPDLSQVTVRNARQALQGTPAQLLSQGAALREQFRIEEAGWEGKQQRLWLHPRSHNGDFQSVLLLLRDGVPVRMEFRDQLGGVTEVRFSAIHKNEKLDSQLFRFDPPPGTEVIQAAPADTP